MRESVKLSRAKMFRDMGQWVSIVPAESAPGFARNDMQIANLPDLDESGLQISQTYERFPLQFEHFPESEEILSEPE